MILGGFVGAIIATYIPLSLLSEYNMSILSILIALSIGLILPVPMFADIILTYALYQTGVHPEICMALLITLPTTSIFSLAIIAKYFHIQIAVRLAISTFMLGALGAYILQIFL